MREAGNMADGRGAEALSRNKFLREKGGRHERGEGGKRKKEERGKKEGKGVDMRGEKGANKRRVGRGVK